MGVKRLIGPQVDAQVIHVGRRQEVTRRREGDACRRRVHKKAINQSVVTENRRMSTQFIFTTTTTKSTCQWASLHNLASPEQQQQQKQEEEEYLPVGRSQILMLQSIAELTSQRPSGLKAWVQSRMGIGNEVEQEVDHSSKLSHRAMKRYGTVWQSVTGYGRV